MEEFDESAKWKFWIKLGAIAVGCILAVIFIICIINFAMKQYSKKHTTTSIESTLEKVLAINELHSYEYSYDSWATIKETKYDMETYYRYQNLSTILTQDKNRIDSDSKNLEQSFQKYKENLNTRNSIYQDLLNDGVQFETIANAGYQDETLFSIAQNSVSSKEPIDIYKYYYYSLLPERLSILSICENYNDLCDLEQFLKLNEKKALKSVNSVKYVVAYEGKVRAGIDEEIKLQKDDNGKFLIIVPKVKILSVAVNIPADEKNKSVIEITKKSTNDDYFFKEAMRQCHNELYAKISMEQQFLKLAQENLVETIKALIIPFLDGVDYEITFIGSNEEE